MKIYTSYFGNLRKLYANGVTPICIARGIPRFFGGKVNQSVAPYSWMLKGDLTTEQYTEAYYGKVLINVDAKQFVNQLEEASQGNDVALLCYEKPSDFCHRHLLAKWLEEKLGIEVKEFDVIGEPWNPKNPKVEQGNLFD